jgi:hypothetical protein
MFITNNTLITQFSNLKVSNHNEKVIEWIKKNFRETETTNDLINLLQKNCLSGKFYKKKHNHIIFYFCILDDSQQKKVIKSLKFFL